ncbi:hypothetical protein O4H49_02605 [Kiloniella laminariae]|uniref:Uncharacterized protein n=1 Tax=Kiloniella laminariae TaxID=454162 RepID=A0ABT4LEZ0_9PROT|nr:hypothetical protein [Kiloniella laminariae]MCZ4279652.1 hypothetical protein [Kiloniella laminariae]
MAKRDLFSLIAKQAALRKAASARTNAAERRKRDSEARKKEIEAERDRQALLLLEEHRGALFHINELLDSREKMMAASSSSFSGQPVSPSAMMEQLREFRHYVGELEQSDFPDLSDKEYLVKTRQRVAEQWEATCQRCGQLMRDVVRHKSELQQHRRELEQLYPLIFLRDRMRAGRFWFDGGVTRLRIGLGFGAFILLLSILSLGESRYQDLLFVVTGGFLLCLLGLFGCSLMQKGAKDKLRQELDLLCKSENCPPPVIAKDYFDLDGVEHLIPNDLATIVYGKRYRTKGKSGHPERDTSQEAEREAARLTSAGLSGITDAIESELRGIRLQLAELDRELGWEAAAESPPKTTT